MSVIFWEMGGRRRFISLKHIWTVDDFFVWMMSTILTFTAFYTFMNVLKNVANGHIYSPQMWRT